MSIQKQILISIILLITTIFIFTFTNLDIMIQDLFFNFEAKSWYIDKHNMFLKYIFYIIPKRMIVISGVLTLLTLIYFFLTKKYLYLQKRMLFVILSLIFVPLLIAGSKQITNMYCPDNIQRYGSTYPYVKILEPFPDDFPIHKKGKCYPAGHATGGFALLSLYFVLNKKYRNFALFGSLSLGSIMGLYQIAKGAHYLSDSLVTLILSYIIISILRTLITIQSDK